MIGSFQKCFTGLFNCSHELWYTVWPKVCGHLTFVLFQVYLQGVQSVHNTCALEIIEFFLSDFNTLFRFRPFRSNVIIRGPHTYDSSNCSAKQLFYTSFVPSMCKMERIKYWRYTINHWVFFVVWKVMGVRGRAKKWIRVLLRSVLREKTELH